MSAILPSLKIDSDTVLARCFMPHQLHWIQAEDAIHAQHKQAYALAEKSIRIGWTYADAFKNVRKRLRFKKRDYLFATKDYPSALEYIRLCYEFADLFNYARSIIAHGEDPVKIQRLNADGQATGFTEDAKVSYIEFDNHSRIIAFSAHPQSMAVYGGDVGLDEFAKHPNARLLWETAQGRITWNGDIAVWSSHDGLDKLFHQFVLQARAGAPPWNLYYRVTLPDAIGLGLVDTINRVQGTRLSAEQFLADCRARAGSEEIFEQAYLCNPMGADSSHIVEYSAIENCRADYQILRAHLEHDEILKQFGPFRPDREREREQQITDFIQQQFLPLFRNSNQYRLGFDVAASGQGNLAVIYIDELKTDELWLRGLFSCRTEDWNFLSTVLAAFLSFLQYYHAAGDETGLGRQICWDAAKMFPGRFTPVNFSSKKHDLGFGLMNQLATAKKRFPRAEQDIAADYFALRKVHQATRWVFTESPNTLNPSSHCDIAWAGALASEANNGTGYEEPWALLC